MRSWFVVALVAACSDHKEAPPVAPPLVVLAADARVAAPGASGSGMHLDDDVGPRVVQPASAGRVGQAIDITLRSSPTGASAAVDGVPVGTTPTHWSGFADGQLHEFTFTRSGYAFARYRFVPITSGVIHATLEPIGEDADAGVPPVSDQRSAFTPAPPPTIVAPPVDAAIPTPTPPTGGAGPQP